VFGGLFQRLQKSVETVAGQHCNFVNQGRPCNGLFEGSVLNVVRGSSRVSSTVGAAGRITSIQIPPKPAFINLPARPSRTPQGSELTPVHIEALGQNTARWVVLAHLGYQ